MKIIFDKLKEGHSYPLNHKELKQILKIIPNEWVKGIKLIHFLGQSPDSSRFERPVRKELLSGKLNLSILGLKKEEVVKEIMIELIQNSSTEPNLKAKSFRKLDKNQIKRIKEIMAPYYEEWKKKRCPTTKASCGRYGLA